MWWDDQITTFLLQKIFIKEYANIWNRENSSKKKTWKTSSWLAAYNKLTTMVDIFSSLATESSTKFCSNTNTLSCLRLWLNALHSRIQEHSGKGYSSTCTTKMYNELRSEIKIYHQGAWQISWILFLAVEAITRSKCPLRGLVMYT